MPLFFSYLCGGECLEDINTLVGHFRQRPGTLLPGADTVGRGLKELSEEDTVYKSESSGMSYRFNTAEKLNVLLLRMIRRMGLIKVGSPMLTWTSTISSSPHTRVRRKYKRFYRKPIVKAFIWLQEIASKDRSLFYHWQRGQTPRLCLCTKSQSVKSRVRGDFHARFCERARVKLPRST